MLGKKIKITNELFAKLEQAAQLSRCSSTEEFALSVLETEANRVINSSKQQEMSPEEIKAIENQLQGLGYIE